MLLQDLEGPSFQTGFVDTLKAVLCIGSSVSCLTLTLFKVLRIKHTFLEPTVIVLFVNTAYSRRNL